MTYCGLFEVQGTRQVARDVSSEWVQTSCEWVSFDGKSNVVVCRSGRSMLHLVSTGVFGDESRGFTIRLAGKPIEVKLWESEFGWVIWPENPEVYDVVVAGFGVPAQSLAFSELDVEHEAAARQANTSL